MYKSIAKSFYEICIKIINNKEYFYLKLLKFDFLKMFIVKLFIIIIIYNS